MTLVFQVIAAFVLDLILGDPRPYPHPVKIISQIARTGESFTRWLFRNQKLAGIITTLSVIIISYFGIFFIIDLLGKLHPFAGIASSIFFIYSTLSIRSLFDESLPVFKFLKEENLPEARKSLSNIVGRDTENLDEEGIVRATVETVAESTVDGIISPLFYAVIGGAPMAMAYKAANTMDSLFGYKNEKYIEFGWGSARLDDLANWLPARLSVPLMTVAAAVCGLNGSKAWTIANRDGRKHPSPNAGFPEAAMAGALGIQLGGINHYSGIENHKPLLGDSGQKLEIKYIIQSQKLMFISSFLAMLVLLAYGSI
ncbi:MAG: cobalamin biosynthesis protein CobD [Nitrospinae bacterium]|nr:cobalamin biosynthesis protein CobD [Nitrospinota bacterium]